MTFAVKPAAQPGADWTEVHAYAGEEVAGLMFSAAWLDGLSDEECAGFNLLRAEIDETDAPAGRRLVGSRIEGSPPRRVWLTEDYSLEDIAILRAQRIAEVKAEAGRRILERYPTWKQANMNMRATELVDIRLDRVLTAEETAEREAMLSASAWIKEVRTASDAIEAALPEDAEGLCAFDAAAADGWPA